MIKIAIYARYSDELQSPTSIDDQISRCKEYISKIYDKNDYDIVMIGSDSEKTGKYLFKRDGMKKIIDAGQNDKIDYIVTEESDRISRSASDLTQLYKIFEYHNVKIISVKLGRIVTIYDIILSCLTSEYMLDNLRDKTKRGLIEKAKRGEIPAGLVYGYLVDYRHNDRGGIDKGLRIINEEQANIIRYVFDEYAKGISLKAIALDLNKKNIPSPSGGLWRITSLAGVPAKNEGILNKPIYIGKVVYNVTKKITNPSTGKVKTIANPPAEWVVGDAPNLRIVTDKQWHAVKAMQLSKRYNQSNKAVKVKSHEMRSSRPFTELVKCGACGGRKTIANLSRYVCDNYRYKRSCNSSRGTKEPKILFHVTDKLSVASKLIPDWESYFLEKMANQIDNKKKLKKEEKQLHDKLDKYLDAIGKGVKGAIKRSNDTQYQIDGIREKIDNLDAIPTNHNKIQANIDKSILMMQESFFDDGYSHALSLLLHTIIDKIILSPIKEKSMVKTLKLNF